MPFLGGGGGGGGGAEGAQTPHFSSFYCFGNALVLLINFETSLK